MSVIDMHTHVFPSDVADRAIGKLIDEGGLTAYYDGTAKGLLASMDRSRVDVSVLLPVATRPSQVESINTWTASLASERFIPFGAMHPEFEKPEREMERMVELGLRGIKFHPEFQDFDPTSEQMQPIYRAAVRLGLVILFHAGEDPNYPGVRGVPSAFTRVLDAHPDLTLVLAHMGGYQIWDKVAKHLMGANVYLDTAYTIGHLPNEDFMDIARGHGIDRILFGTDGPWTDPVAELAELRSMGFSDDELDGILWRNAATLLGVDLLG